MPKKVTPTRKDTLGVDIKPGDLVLVPASSVTLGIVIKFNNESISVRTVDGYSSSNNYRAGSCMSVQQGYEDRTLYHQLLADGDNLYAAHINKVVYTAPKPKASTDRYLLQYNSETNIYSFELVNGNRKVYHPYHVYCYHYV